MATVDAQELRRRWTNKTKANFGPRDYINSRVYEPEAFERIFDFSECKSIVFYNGSGTKPTDVILMTDGSGHMVVPANVRVSVNSGYARCEAEESATDGSTVVGRGARAPPPSRVDGFARSSAGSAYSAAGRRGMSTDSYGSYTSRRSSADSDEWQVVAELAGFRDDATVHPDDSISSVGATPRVGGGGSSASRRFSHQG
ncbi:hypothetical protein MFIFM68171_03970 [Madurella fahalii]|uniref:Uncharacterized protein n=1 Tax=Madurella fahalii TaxID=1157608 RepID=A0ABQ0G7M9_9PEZI